MTDADRRPGNLPTGYVDLLEQVKDQVRTARTQAARAVNTELVAMYWKIGKLLLDRREAQGWGTGVVARLAADLRAEFPEMRGFSSRNLAYMRSLAVAYPDEILQQPAAQLPWGHLMVLLDKVSDPTARDWYAAQAVQHGWSRGTLTHHISSNRHDRKGIAPNNFTATLAPDDSDLAREILHDPYELDFLALDPGYTERQLEDALIAQLTGFLTELGAGFAFVGRQYRLPVGGRDYFADLLFFHLGLRRFVVIELKVGQAEPEHLGKLNLYVNAIDDQLRRPDAGDGSTIGILLAADRDDIVVEYALRGIETPMAVSTYTHRALPDELRPALPSADDLAQVVHDARRRGQR